jgi:hypothetical protein
MATEIPPEVYEAALSAIHAAACGPNCLQAATERQHRQASAAVDAVWLLAVAAGRTRILAEIAGDAPDRVEQTIRAKVAAEIRAAAGRDETTDVFAAEWAARIAEGEA